MMSFAEIHSLYALSHHQMSTTIPIRSRRPRGTYGAIQLLLIAHTIATMSTTPAPRAATVERRWSWYVMPA